MDAAWILHCCGIDRQLQLQLPLAWGLPYATGEVLKRKKKKRIGQIVGTSETDVDSQWAGADRGEVCNKGLRTWIGTKVSCWKFCIQDYRDGNCSTLHINYFPMYIGDKKAKCPELHLIAISK